MNNNPCVLFLVSLMTAVAVTYAADTSKGNDTVQTYNSDVLGLEQEWISNPQASYFSKALTLSRAARPAAAETNVEVHTFQLDLASGVLLKSRDGSEFGSDASAVRHCQAEIIGKLAAVDVGRMKDLAAWPELRARYARLLMLERAIWVSSRDPTLDGEMIELDSTIRLQPAPASAQERLIRNQRVSLQGDLKRFMAETAPLIDRFMIAAFSMEPVDFRMLNELLAMGFYTAEERARLVTAAEKKTEGRRVTGKR